MKKIKGRIFAVLLAATVVTAGIATSALAVETENESNIVVMEAGTNTIESEVQSVSAEEVDPEEDAEEDVVKTEISSELSEDITESLDNIYVQEDTVSTEGVTYDNGAAEGACIDKPEVGVKEATFIKFDKRLDYQVYDGQPHGLYAAVYNLNNEYIADACLYYTGVEADGTVYRSQQPPVNAGAYQVTAYYFGDNEHYMAPVDVYASLIICPAPAAVVRINDITSDCGEEGPFEYSYETEGVFPWDIDRILTDIYCEESAPDTTHPINGTVNAAVAKNYESVTVIPGTHYIVCEKTVYLTVITNGMKGRFVDYANPTFEALPVEDGAVYVLPEVQAYPGYEFIGWIIRGEQHHFFGPQFKNLNYVDLARFDKTGHVGALLAEAVYKRVCPPIPPCTKDTEEPGTKDTEEPGTKDTEEPGTKDTEEPGTKDTEEPGTKDTKEPGTEDTKEPGTEDTKEPGTEDTKNPDTKQTESKQTGNTKETKDNKKEDSVKTGDRAPIAICFMMLALSFASMVVVIFARKRR